MTRTLISILAAFIVLGYFLAANAIHELVPSESQIPLPGADPAKLSEYIYKHNPYSSWEMWPGKGRFYKGREPHGALLTTFVNKTAYYSIKNKTGMGYDSIIVKENYSPDKRLDALTVMYKLKGYNPAGGDWFWVKYAADRNVLASGKTEACINCHGKNKDNDFVMTGPVR